MSAVKIKKLGDFVEILSGFAFDSERFSDSGEIPLVRIRDVQSGKSCTYYSGEYDPKFVVRDNDVLIGMDGEFNRSRWKGGRALLNQRVCKIWPKSEELDERYLYHFLPIALKKIEDVTPFVTVKHLSVKSIRDIDIPLPSIISQRRIAEILDVVEALRAKRREAIDKLDELTKSIFFEMFGDPATNPKGWPICTVGDLLDSASYGTSEKAGSVGDFPVLRMNNISMNGEISLTDLKYMDLDSKFQNRYFVRRGDVLFNRTNSPELVGKTAIYRHDEKMAYAGYLIRLRVNSENDSEYLAAFLNTVYAKRMLRGMCKSIIGMANINATEIQALKLARPPYAMQKKFSSVIQKIVLHKTVLRRAKLNSDLLFQALQAKAFRGAL